MRLRELRSDAVQPRAAAQSFAEALGERTRLRVAFESSLLSRLGTAPLMR